MTQTTDKVLSRLYALINKRLTELDLSGEDETVTEAMTIVDDCFMQVTGQIFPSVKKT